MDSCERAGGATKAKPHKFPTTRQLETGRCFHPLWGLREAGVWANGDSKNLSANRADEAWCRAERRQSAHGRTNDQYPRVFHGPLRHNVSFSHKTVRLARSADLCDELNARRPRCGQDRLDLHKPQPSSL